MVDLILEEQRGKERPPQYPTERYAKDEKGREIRHFGANRAERHHDDGTLGKSFFARTPTPTKRTQHLDPRRRCNRWLRRQKQEQEVQA